jgi:adenylate kinase family enzyme
VTSAAPRPLLVIVRGKPGSGKTTLVRRLADTDSFGLPLLSRDPIKGGLVETHTCETDAVREVIVPLAFDLFDDTIALWLRARVSLIAENSFPRDRSEPALRTLIRLARAVVIHCETSDEEARRRFLARERANPRLRPDRLAAAIDRMEGETYPWRTFDPYDLGIPSLRVDPTDGYIPTLDAIIAFCRASG